MSGNNLQMADINVDKQSDQKEKIIVNGNVALEKSLQIISIAVIVRTVGTVHCAKLVHPELERGILLRKTK